MELQLYDFQSASVEALRANIRAGIRSQILSAATGSGKTVIAAYLLDECNNKSKRAVFVVDRVNLVNQTSALLDKYQVPHGILQAQHWRWRPWERIQVASAQTLEKRGWPEDIDLIITDECHAVRKCVIDRIAQNDCITIGLSATPFTKGLGKHYQSVVTVTTTNKLIQEQYLAPYRIFAASAPDMTGVKVVAGEWEEKETANRAMPIIGDIVAEYLKHGDGKKFIAFGVDVAHCTEMQKQMLAAGVKCELYTYRTTPEECEKILEEFRLPDSRIRGLISVSKLSKGFDVADIEVIIMARPLRSSLSEHIQIFGRGLRSDPFNPTKVCTVLDHANNTVRFWDAMQDFFENGTDTLDDGKRKPKKKAEKREKKPRKCPKCFAVHDPAPACPHCGFVYPVISTTEHQSGTLIELTGGSAPTKENKQDFYAQLRFLQNRYGYKDGWVAWKFKERFGVWPRGLEDIEKEPSPALMGWIRSQQIRYAKSKR